MIARASVDGLQFAGDGSVADQALEPQHIVDCVDVELTTAVSVRAQSTVLGESLKIEMLRRCFREKATSRARSCALGALVRIGEAGALRCPVAVMICGHVCRAGSR